MIASVRPGVVLALGVAARAASADPRLEASTFVGVATFGDRSQLGDGRAPGQRPGTSPMLGGRLQVVLAPHIGLDRELGLRAGLEGELAVAPGFTAPGPDDREAYLAPVFGWRAHGVLGL